MKIAWFSPFSQQSAIGKCSAEVIQALRPAVDVTLYASDLDAAGDGWLPDLPLRRLRHLSPTTVITELSSYDGIFYALGDNPQLHQTIFEYSQQVPGIVILHDLVMHHFFAGYYLDHRREPAAYVRELTYGHGAAGRAYGLSVVNGTAQRGWLSDAMLEFHMARSALRGSRGIVVHSAYARQAIDAFAEAPVWQLSFPTPTLRQASSAPPAPLAVKPRQIRLLTFGMVNENKMIAEVIEAIGQSRWLRDQVVYHIIGQAGADDAYVRRLAELRQRYELTDQVVLLGYQPDAVLGQYQAQADVIINVRNPHFGESSYVLLEASFLGKPILVWQHGSYAEYPDDSVVKIDSVASLQPTLERLCGDVEWRRQLSQSVRQYAEQTFITEEYARNIIDIVNITGHNRPVLDLTDRAAALLVEMGVTSEWSTLIDYLTGEIAALAALPSDHPADGPGPPRGRTTAQ